jgi:hypothetical protein
MGPNFSTLPILKSSPIVGDMCLLEVPDVDNYYNWSLSSTKTDHMNEREREIVSVNENENENDVFSVYDVYDVYDESENENVIMNVNVNVNVNVNDVNVNDVNVNDVNENENENENENVNVNDVNDVNENENVIVNVNDVNDVNENENVIVNVHVNVNVNVNDVNDVNENENVIVNVNDVNDVNENENENESENENANSNVNEVYDENENEDDERFLREKTLGFFTENYKNHFSTPTECNEEQCNLSLQMQSYHLAIEQYHGCHSFPQLNLLHRVALFHRGECSFQTKVLPQIFCVYFCVKMSVYFRWKMRQLQGQSLLLLLIISLLYSE